MARSPGRKPPSIIPTNFDKAVCEVVETIITRGKDTNPLFKKQVLASIGIDYTNWPNMLNHQRHVTTKVERIDEIIHLLKGIYDVDPEFIRQYPNYKPMFLTAIVADDGGPDTYHREIPVGGVSTLQRELKDAYKQLRDMENKIIRFEDENKRLKLSLDAAHQLINSLQPSAKNPDKTSKKQSIMG